MCTSATLEPIKRPVLSAYKRLLKLALRLPPSDAVSARVQIRATFREHQAERNESRCVQVCQVFGS